MIGSSSAIAKRRRVGASHEIADSSRLRGSRGRSYDATTTSGARGPGFSGARQPIGPIAHDATSARSIQFVRLAIAGAEDILDSPELHMQTTDNASKSTIPSAKTLRDRTEGAS